MTNTNVQRSYSSESGTGCCVHRTREAHNELKAPSMILAARLVDVALASRNPPLPSQNNVLDMHNANIHPRGRVGIA